VPERAKLTRVVPPVAQQIRPRTYFGRPLLSICPPSFCAARSTLNYCALDISIVLPLARPGIAAVTILTGVWMWNDFIVALILATRPSIHTLPVGIMSFFGVYSTEWTLAFASVAIAATPFLLAYLALTRQFIAGLSVGAVRG